MNNEIAAAKALSGYEGLRSRFTKFIQWWLAELRGLLPQKVSYPQISKKRAEIIFHDAGDKLDVYYQHQATCEFKGALAYDTLAQETLAYNAMEELQQLVPQERASVQYVLCIAAQKVVSKVIALPKAAQENLENVLRYELDRHTPFNTEQAYFDYSVVEEDAASGVIYVSIRAISRDYLDGLLDKLEACVHHSPIVVIADNIAGCEQWEMQNPFRLSADSARGSGYPPNNRINMMLSVAVCMLLASILIVPFVKLDNAADGLRQQLNGLRKQLQDVESTRGEINAIIQDLQMLKQKKQLSKNVVDIMLEVTRLLPDDTWLENLELKQGRLVIQGQSKSASAMIAVIEASSMFEKVKFQSPVVQNPGDASERFIIVAEISKETVQDA